MIVKGWKEEISVTLSTSTVPTPKEQVHLISTQQPEAHRIHTECKQDHTKNRGLIFHDHIQTTWMEYVQLQSSWKMVRAEHAIVLRMEH